MAFWKQLFLSVALLCVALWAAALWMPGAAGMLRSWGLGQVMDQMGLPAEAAAPVAPGAGRPRGAGGGAMVRAEPPGEGRVADIVAAIGDGRALRSVTLYSQTPGHTAEVLVQSGQRVTAGAVILRLDSEAEEIGLERARLVLDDARTRRDRVQQLRGSGAATDVQIREAELAVRQAELGLRQAEFDLEQRTLLAPIDGWLGILNVEPGTQVSTQTEIAQIDDRSALLVEFRLPESMVGRVAMGDIVEAESLAGGQGRVTGHVSAIDNRVDAASRTLRVQARLDNAEDRLRAGMAFSIRIALPGIPAASVDPLAVQWSREGAFVWVVRDGLATRLPIAILQRADEVVMVEADFQPGDLVVVEGVQSVRPGAPVTLQGEG